MWCAILTNGNTKIHQPMNDKKIIYVEIKETF